MHPILKNVLIGFGCAGLYVGMILISVWLVSRPPTCEMGKMKSCHGGGIQFCQHDHYTPCYDIKPHHLYPGQDPKP